MRIGAMMIMPTLRWAFPASLLILAALALPDAAAQQRGVITGTVTSEDGRPLQGAHVYLAGTMQGAIAGQDGSFRLAQLPLGAHRVVASMLGYELETREVLLREPAEYEVRFVMREAIHELGVVEVSAREQRRWQRRLARFKQTLFGTSTFADSLSLLNPEVLDFSVRFGKLTATARAPLEIENRALGYHLRYDLTVFEALPHRVRYDGEPLFRELEPRDEAEADRWAANRAVAYGGSLRHLLRALIADDLAGEGFHVHHRHEVSRGARAYVPTSAYTWPIRVRRVLTPTEHENEYRLAFRGNLKISYHGAGEDDRFPYWEWNVERRARPQPFQSSEIYLARRYAIVDARGELTDPFAVVRMGYLAFRRLAMLLPVEYLPQTTDVATATH
jgi:hypothetical protein